MVKPWWAISRFVICARARVEFARSVARFAEAHHARVPEPVEERPEAVVVDLRQRLGVTPDQFGKLARANVTHRSILPLR